MPHDLLREKLAAGKPAIGTFCTAGSVENVELACHCGFDFVIVDWEHGAFSREQVREAARAIHTTKVTPIARPPSHDLANIKWMLDMGYSGLLLPMVNSADQARAVVQAAYYPPVGQRSQGFTRANLYFGSDYRASINDHLQVFTMMEHIDALREIRQVAATPGIGGCFIGTGDLGSSMGTSAGGGEYERIIQQVLDATLEAGKVPGIYVPSPREAVDRIKQGFRMVAIDHDLRMLSNAMRGVLREFQEMTG